MADERACILLVDDEEDFLRPTRRHLERRRMNVLTAPDGVEALALYERHHEAIDAVVTDIKMPRMDGLELIARLREHRHVLPIIGVTGANEFKERAKALDHGAYYYIEKPLPDFQALDTLIDNAVRFGRHEKKRLEIARLVRSYIVSPPAEGLRARDRSRHTLDYDIVLLPLESDQPSGDFAEYVERRNTETGSDELLFYVADVAGHFDLVATFTACLSSLVLHRTHHQGQPPVDEIVLAIDRALDGLRTVGAFSRHRFLTFFIGAIDLVSGKLTYVNAGHPPGFLVRPGADGEPPRILHLESNCGAVSFLSLIGIRPRVSHEQLEPGDLLMLYTDGASELLQGDDSIEDGIARLSTLVASFERQSLHELVDEVVNTLHARAGEKGLPDDTTLVAIRLREP